MGPGVDPFQDGAAGGPDGVCRPACPCLHSQDLRAGLTRGPAAAGPARGAQRPFLCRQPGDAAALSRSPGLRLALAPWGPWLLAGREPRPRVLLLSCLQWWLRCEGRRCCEGLDDASPQGPWRACPAGVAERGWVRGCVCPASMGLTASVPSGPWACGVPSLLLMGCSQRHRLLRQHRRRESSGESRAGPPPPPPPSTGSGSQVSCSFSSVFSRSLGHVVSNENNKMSLE